MSDKARSSHPTKLIHSETPRVPLSDAENATSRTVRPQVVHDMEGESVICDLDKFMDAYLPFVPSDADVEKCISEILRPNGIVVDIDTSLRFADYPTPPDGGQTKMKTYEDLETIGQSIASYNYPGRVRNKFHYRHTPYNVIEGSTHKVDACFTSDTPSPGSKKLLLTTTSMAVPMEHKMHSTQNTYDNNTQVVSANVQIMNDDVRRMFTFGITIECDQVTLWCHSRSHSAISRSFSFVEEPKILIKIFMSFLFATEEQLGYDPSVTKEQDSSQYTFEIPQEKSPSRFFRTVEPISTYRSNNITGRMTRVYLVEELGSNPPKRYVLKDVWIDSNAETEGEIQKCLFNDIDALWSSSTASKNIEGLEYFSSLHAELLRSKRYKDFFLTIEADFVGKALHGVAANALPTRGLFTPPPPASEGRTSPTPSSHKTGTIHPMTKARGQQANSTPVTPRRFMPRKRYRVIFHEVCTPVGNIRKLGEVVDVLQQVLIPLQLMFCAGWVHRDISSGNILAYKPQDTKPWQVKLSDLEYAKRFPPPDGYEGATDPKTGTPYFMAHEIYRRNYIYQPVPDSTRLKSVAFNPFAPKSGVSIAADREVIAHNFQHDLESIWWLLLWTLTCRIDHKPSHTWARPYFQNVEEIPKHRDNLFVFPIMAHLSGVLLESVLEFVEPMENLRVAMHADYFNRVRDGKHFTKNAYVEIQQMFNLFFQGVQLISDSDWRIIDLIPDDPYHNDFLLSQAPETSPTPVTETAATPSPEQNSSAQQLGEPVVTPAQPPIVDSNPRVQGPARVKRARAVTDEPNSLRPGDRQSGKRSRRLAP